MPCHENKGTGEKGTGLTECHALQVLFVLHDGSTSKKGSTMEHVKSYESYVWCLGGLDGRIGNWDECIYTCVCMYALEVTGRGVFL